MPLAALKAFFSPATLNATVTAATARGLPASSSSPSTPIYHFHRENLIPGLPDVYLSILAPFVVYWAASLLFELVDRAEWPVFEQYRIHEPEELTKKNRVTKAEVIKAVIVQQVIQTVLGLVWLSEDDPAFGPFRDHGAAIEGYSARIAWLAVRVLGAATGKKTVEHYGSRLAHWVYWWGVPIAQFAFAAFVLDAWQYFLHRYFHENRFLYRHVHSWHHRLYVPYAFGALYNHPLEGFLFDTLGATIAHSCALMTARQGVLFFAISTAKTVDDHCGFAFPWDPLQHLFGNNADYHDIHHQIGGLKANFSQPYFIHFDYFLNTRMTRSQYDHRASLRNKRTPPVTQDSAVNGPNELAAEPTSERSGKALKAD